MPGNDLKGAKDGIWSFVHNLCPIRDNIAPRKPKKVGGGHPVRRHFHKERPLGDNRPPNHINFFSPIKAPKDITIFQALMNLPFQVGEEIGRLQLHNELLGKKNYERITEKMFSYYKGSGCWEDSRIFMIGAMTKLFLQPPADPRGHGYNLRGRYAQNQEIYFSSYFFGHGGMGNLCLFPKSYWEDWMNAYSFAVSVLNKTFKQPPEITQAYWMRFFNDYVPSLAEWVVKAPMRVENGVAGVMFGERNIHAEAKATGEHLRSLGLSNWNEWDYKNAELMLSKFVEAIDRYTGSSTPFIKVKEVRLGRDNRHRDAYPEAEWGDENQLRFPCPRWSTMKCCQNIFFCG